MDPERPWKKCREREDWYGFEERIVQEINESEGTMRNKLLSPQFQTR